MTDEDGRVERFLEEPSWVKVFSDTINTGIYVLEPEVLKHIPQDRPYDFSKELFPLLLEMGRPIYGHVFDGYWQDIGNLDQYRQANFDALDESVQLEYSPGSASAATSGWGTGWTSTTSTRSRGLRTSATTAAWGAAPTSARTACSPRASPCASGAASSAPSSTPRPTSAEAPRWWGRSSAGAATCALMCGCTRASAIGDEVTVGAESVILPGVRIYPFKEVETGSTLHESLIWESRGTTRVFGKSGVAGMVNVDLTPDVAVRLAAALGTALKRGARVVASRESAAACRMIKRAMISGLSSTGVHVDDLRVSPAGVARHLVKSEAHEAGFHVGVSPTDPEVIRIQFFV